MAILAIEMYLAHRNGKTIEELADALDLSADVVALRIRAAELFVNHQLQML